MNVYTVRRATQGLANYLKAHYAQASVAISFDSRIKSDRFAREAARVLAGNGCTVYLFPQLDRVLWMENGTVTAGTHEELLQKVPAYRALAADQEGGKNRA